MRKLIIHPKDKSTDFLKVIYAGRDDCTVITGGTFDEVREAIKSHDHIIMMGHGTPQGLLAVGQFREKPLSAKPAQPNLRNYVDRDRGKEPSLLPAPKGKLDIDAAIKRELDSTDYLKESDFDLGDDDWFAKDSERVTMAGSGHYTTTATKPSNFRSTSYGGYSKGYIDRMTKTYVIDDSHVELLRGKKLTTIWCNADQFIEWNDLSGFYTGMFISEKGEAALIGTESAEQWEVDESNYGFVSIVRQFIDASAEELHEALRAEYGVMAEYNPVARYNYRRLYVAGEGNAPVENGEKSASESGSADKASVA